MDAVLFSAYAVLAVGLVFVFDVVTRLRRGKHRYKPSDEN